MQGGGSRMGTFEKGSSVERGNISERGVGESCGGGDEVEDIGRERKFPGDRLLT